MDGRLINEWLTLDEVKQIFDWNTRQHVWRVSHREGWKTQKQDTEVSRAYLYFRDDVLAFQKLCQRTKVVEALKGTYLVGYFRQDEYDTTCPTCGKFAVYEPPRPGEAPQTCKEEIEKGVRAIRCVAGHVTSIQSPDTVRIAKREA